MSIPLQKTLSDPQLVDNTLGGINAALLDNLTWLDNAFGKSQRLTKKNVEGKEYFSPNVPVQSSTNREYLEMFPDDNLGNFVFWDVKDGEKAANFPGEYYFLTAKCGLVFWGNLEKIYPTTHRTKTIENVKREVRDVLTNINIISGEFLHGECWERAENIYPGYTHREVKDQFLMLPYVGFRIDCEVRIRVVCAELEPI